MTDSINDIIREVVRFCISMFVIDVGLMIAIATLWIKINTLHDDFQALNNIICSTNTNSEYCQKTIKDAINEYSR